MDEQRVDVTIGDNAVVKKGEVRKEAPIWMTKSTVINETTADSSDTIGGPAIMDEVTNSVSLILLMIHYHVGVKYRLRLQAMLQRRTVIKRTLCRC